MNPANDNTTLDEDLAEANALAAKAIMDEPVKLDDLSTSELVAVIPQEVVAG